MKLLKEIRACKACDKHLPFSPRPVVHFSSASKIIIIGQAPGTKVHESGIPWDDASGKRLREWLQVETDEFYDTKKFGIVPMGFCYPGKGKSGDLPPRPECADLWMEPVLRALKNRKITILIGQYSQKFFLSQRMKATLTETVKSWEEYLPDFFVLPHPSPRNNIWLKKNEWFERETIPQFRKIIKKHLR